MTLAKRETARRSLYSRFFRGPVLGPADVQPEIVKTVTPPPSDDDDDARRNQKRKRKKGEVVPTEEDLDKEEEKEERRRRKRLRKEAERAARKLGRRHEEKNLTKDGDGDDSGPVDETILLSAASREEASGPLVSTTPDEVPKGKRRRNGSRLHPVENGLVSQVPVTVDERTLDGDEHGHSGRSSSSKSSRKRRRRDQYP